MIREVTHLSHSSENVPCASKLLEIPGVFTAFNADLSLWRLQTSVPGSQKSQMSIVSFPSGPAITAHHSPARGVLWVCRSEPAVSCSLLPKRWTGSTGLRPGHWPSSPASLMSGKNTQNFQRLSSRNAPPIPSRWRPCKWKISMSLILWGQGELTSSPSLHPPPAGLAQSLVETQAWRRKLSITGTTGSWRIKLRSLQTAMPSSLPILSHACTRDFRLLALTHFLCRSWP